MNSGRTWCWNRYSQQRRALLLGHAGEAQGVAAVDVERLAPGLRVRAHHRVLGLVAPSRVAPAARAVLAGAGALRLGASC